MVISVILMFSQIDALVYLQELQENL